jgi:hypothetical protein
MSHGRKHYKTRPTSNIIIYKITTLYKTLYVLKFLWLFTLYACNVQDLVI